MMNDSICSNGIKSLYHAGIPLKTKQPFLVAKVLNSKIERQLLASENSIQRTFVQTGDRRLTNKQQSDTRSSLGSEGCPALR